MASGQNLIVMGPGGSDYPSERGDMLEAPMLTNKTDKFVYRRNVRMWYECVQSSAESGYSKAMGTSKNLGHALFSRMDQQYKRIVHSAIDNGSIRLRTHPDGKKFTDEEHVECVEKILNLVAKETTTDRVKRLIRMTKEVHECKRGAKESFAEYAVKFESLSRAYLSIAKARPDSQDEQNFAIMAIENAKLPIATYNAIISNLVSHAKDNVRVTMTHVPAEKIRSLVAEIRELHQRAPNLTMQAQDAESMANTVQDTQRLVSSLHHKIQDLPIPMERSSEDNEDHAISLTKALEELHDVKAEDQQQTVEKDGKTNDTQNTNQTKQLGAMMSGRDDNRKPKRKNRRDRSQYNHQRNSRKRQHDRRKHSYRTHSSRHDTHSEDEDTSSDDEYEKPRSKKGSVFNRLGKQDDSQHPHKKVRFEHREEKEGFDSDNDSYFRKTDRHRS